jgi:ribosomal protein S18 acetylase RimI-like enzyme
MDVQISKVSISPFTMEQYDEVYALWQNCECVCLSSADSRQNIATYLDRNPMASFVARDGDTLIAVILCGHDGRRGYIHHLAVQQNYRRQGIGRCLVEHGLTALKEKGIQKCHLFIFHENESGIAFWQSVGWTFRQDIRVMSMNINEGNM